MIKKAYVLAFSIFLLMFQNVSFAAVDKKPTDFSEETKECVNCHQKNNPSIIQHWGDSKHYRAKVGCYECHQADEGDPDAFIHDDKKVKKLISVIVSPKDCANCHEKEVNEMTNSHHAKAGRIMGSLDNLLAEVVEGNSSLITEGFPNGVSPAAVSGCWQCHGSVVKVLKDGALDPATWPNTGIGRINPDGSEGSCSACHARHSFSVAQARQPENCGRCHLGPDHPQKEIYEESKHGVNYRANKDKMNLDSAKWIPGEDYNAAPTCATCHISATKNQAVTHDVGMRISWNNRPPVSIRPEVSDAKMGLPGANVNWEERRKNMKDVCASCHNEEYVDAFYTQYDGLVNLYNEKFAKPGLKLMEAAAPLMNPVKFSSKLDFIWFELWHHEGRRARHAAAMMGPDYTHWHGTYDLAKHFYTEMVPELNELIEKNHNSSDAAKADAARNLKNTLDEVLNSEDHRWFLGKEDPEKAAARKKAAEDFKARYK
jgi:formate-dependent nitrite reductase cytochrome c552 subunit